MDQELYNQATRLITTQFNKRFSVSQLADEIICDQDGIKLRDIYFHKHLYYKRKRSIIARLNCILKELFIQEYIVKDSKKFWLKLKEINS